LRLLREGNLLELGAAADRMSRALHPGPVRTFASDRNINYTNVCASGCRFCAFYRRPGHPEGYVIDFETLGRKIDEALELGASHILLQGGLNPDLDITFHERMLRFIRAEHPIAVHGFSPPEIIHIARTSGIGLKETIERLCQAGLGSIPGGGAEILSDRVRAATSPRKCTAREWIEVMRTAHGLGLATTATMMFGSIETLEERVEHLTRIRDLQDETGGFVRFIPWTFQPANTELEASGEVRHCAGGYGYLVMLAVSRLFLDNIPAIQASWVTQGSKIAQIALTMGADDLGSTMIEENVVRAAGVRLVGMAREEMERLISEAGFEPRMRDAVGEPIPA
jgi:cyclic dehypoxanthinyl futalosine synthase